MLPYVISNTFALFTILFISNVATAYGTNPQLWNSSTEASGSVLSPLSTIHTSSHYHHHLRRNFCILPMLHGMEGHKNTNACNSLVCNERWGGGRHVLVHLSLDPCVVIFICLGCAGSLWPCKCFLLW